MGVWDKLLLKKSIRYPLEYEEEEKYFSLPRAWRRKFLISAKGNPKFYEVLDYTDKSAHLAHAGVNRRFYAIYWKSP